VVRGRYASTAIGPTDLPDLPVISGAWRRVATASGRISVPAGSALDLGATGKAFAADRISTAIAEQTGTDCILSIGGDVAVGGEREHPWQVAVSERPDEEQSEIISLTRGGIATSTTRYRTWQRGNETMHHLLDPATGRPVARHWRTATVRARDCVSANSASTAALVLGERAGDWLEERGLSARLVAQDGSVTTLGGWPGPARRIR
jgi:FAD:protein FMN transferase